MSWHASAINGYSTEASDGDIGTVSGFLSDDANWLVVDTGNWLSGRKVLLPPSGLGRLNANNRVFPVKLTKKQIKDSPEIDTDRPASRQMETRVYDYNGWNPYWGSGLYMGGYGHVPAPGCLHHTWECRPARRSSSKPSPTATMCICEASKRSPGIISTPAMARSAMSRTSSPRIPIGASIILSPIQKTCGPGERSPRPVGW